ncbi:hypothetical protein [Campylobacter jejuni]|uniref:hypothetical protein n=1 Tax=Campylobacter jejuni TaxID=197 RepID=UPI000F809A59|nr:hypothetical protein [Campylobacter jejuni]RTK09323.1 hypothetical protein C3H38_03520 [Campylobacter jejuni]HEF7931707.1 hypothetical protein [Campylobacter jejuni]
MKSPIVYIVHCVDTEGPLYQNCEILFDMIEKLFNVKIESTLENLKQLRDGTHKIYQSKDINKEAIQTFLDPQLNDSHGSWNEIDNMLKKITSREFRYQMKDSFGGGWIYNWFCIDHVGFSGYNPRRRDAGYHNIFDHYSKIENVIKYDHLSFHYHPLPFNGNYHNCGFNFWNSNITEILSRRLIDRMFFPSTFRPGFHTERPDMHFFLEQWIPFDYANQSTKGLDSNQPDCIDGRFGDWRRATTEWEIYHPHHDDYQLPGNCRRYIARCLNMYARLRMITQNDVDEAFERANRLQKNVLLSFTNHDFRDMSFEISRMREMIRESAQKFPNIKFKFSKADAAMRKVLNLEKNLLDLKLNYDNCKKKIHVKSNSNIFGPQPFLAIKTYENKYYHSNFDFYASNHWTFNFDENTLDINAVHKVGIAANTNSGVTEVLVWDLSNDTIVKNVLNNS